MKNSTAPTKVAMLTRETSSISRGDGRKTAPSAETPNAMEPKVLRPAPLCPRHYKAARRASGKSN